MKLLHVDSSVLGPNSVSRLLTSEIVAEQIRRHPGLEILHLDLAESPLSHLSPLHVAALHGAPVDATISADFAKGNASLEALLAADIIVIGAPMYNFAIPSQLKAWIDRITVAGKTFKYTEAGAVGLVPAGKTVFIASSRGGEYSEGFPAAPFDHQERYLGDVLGFIGLTDVTIIRAEGVAKGVDARDAAITAALSSINAHRDAA